MNTDQANRNGTRFPLETLYSVLVQSSEGTPMFMSHDMHRPIGWSAAHGIALHAGVSYLMGLASFPTTGDEEEVVGARARAHIDKKLASVEPDSKRRLDEAAGSHLRPNAFYMSRECATLVQAGVAKQLFPRLFPEKENDKRALIPLADLHAVGPGVYEVADGICVFAHRYLRRSASRWNNLNVPFLQRFQDTAIRNKDFEARIALDTDAIGLSDTYREAIELQFWWGPKFNDNLSEIDTQITRHAATKRDRLFHRIDRTEFWWYDQDALRAFECEEVVDGQTLGIEDADRYACRYAHSMVDLVKNEPHHLDGAVRIYDDEQILRRLDLNMAEAGRHSEYVKLWRVDGRIPVPLWKALLSDYFRDNHLVSEYLGAQVDEKERTFDTEPAVKQPPLPLEFGCDSSPAFLLSFLPPERSKAEADIDVRCDDFFTQGDRRFAAVDLVALDLLKRITCSGVRVSRPDDFVWVAFEDMHAQLPRLRVSNLSMAPAVCRSVATWLQDRGKVGGAAVTGCLDFVSAQAGLRLAFTGAPERIAQGLHALASGDPQLFHEGLKMLQVLRPGTTQSALDCAKPLEAVRTDATFELGRQFIPGAELRANAVGRAVFVPKAAAAQMGVEAALESGEVSAVPVFTVSAATCTTCKRSYLTCSCEGGLVVDKGVFLGSVLTLHSAFGASELAQSG
ncbi:MAG: hypothetical protein IPP91_17625 [Betaproteobacteria bacterium]|nr:hypothetical protein [Betaproteobacteria bacterium]